MIAVQVTGMRLNMAGKYSRGPSDCALMWSSASWRGRYGGGRLHLTLEEEHPSRRDAFRHYRFYLGEPKPLPAGHAALSLEDALSKVPSRLRADELDLVLIDVHD